MLAWVGLVLIASGAQASSGRGERVAVARAAAHWVQAASARDPACFHLLSRSGRAYYPRMRALALRADPAELERLHAVDQLQVLFLRGMLAPKELEAMSEEALLLFALEQGFVGANLRSGDVLRDVVVEGEKAHGRLYKFGLDARPERGLQHFVREGGAWRVQLRGELERMRSEFDAFASRTGLSASEAAFFILEMRLTRKVTPADFVPASAKLDSARVSKPAQEARAPGPQGSMPPLRLVAVRRSLDSDLPLTATIEDRANSLRYVLEPGDAVPPAPAVRLVEVRSDAAVLEMSQERITLPLDSEGPPLGARLPVATRGATPGRRSLLDIAIQGRDREGLMTQWRNVGLRDRPLLLQQASLIPVSDRSVGPSDRIRGLRVRKLTPGSFWNQLGAEPGDLLTRVNGRAIDSMDAWQELVEIAENDLTITLTLVREEKPLRFETRTIRPR